MGPLLYMTQLSSTVYRCILEILHFFLEAIHHFIIRFVGKSHKDCTEKRDFLLNYGLSLHRPCSTANSLPYTLWRIPIMTNHDTIKCWWTCLKSWKRWKRQMRRCELLYFRGKNPLLELLNMRALCVQHQVSVAAWISSGFSPEVGHCVPLVGFDWHFFWEGKVSAPFHPEKPSGTTSKLFQGLSAL